MFGKDKNDNKEQQELPDDGQKAQAQKTTPDERKTFDEDTEFVCVTDCIFGGKRCRSGDTVTGRICPPWFIVKPADKNKKDKEKE